MYGRRPAPNYHPVLLRVISGIGAGGIILVFWLVGGASRSGSALAASASTPGEAATLSFTATIQSGSVPEGVVFWLCADAQADGTGCHQMTTQTDGAYTYQLATTTGSTYHRLEIAWSRESQAVASATPPATTPTATRPAKTPTAQPSAGPLPTLPLHTICPYNEITVTGPKSYTCLVDAALLSTTPTPATPDPAPSSSPANSPPPPVERDTGTLITGLQVVIGLGLVLLVILVPLMLWQRMRQR